MGILAEAGEYRWVCYGWEPQLQQGVKLTEWPMNLGGLGYLNFWEDGWQAFQE